MKAVAVTVPGRGPDGLALLRLPRPKPGPHEVLIEVHTVSASPLEVQQTLAGVGLGAAVRPPRVLGMDPSGVVVGQGADVAGELVGTRVAVKPNVVCGSCRFCRTGNEADCVRQQLLGVHRDGGLAEFVRVPAAQAFVLPDGLPHATASAGVHSVAVALHLLRAAGPLEQGDAVLVCGASGAVGSAAVQLARRGGAHVLATVSDPARAALAVEDGAHEVLDGAATHHLATAVLRSCPDGVRAVLDTTGRPDVLAAALDSLGWRGVLSFCAGAPGSTVPLPLADLYRNRRTVRGVAATDFADVRQALGLLADGGVGVRIAEEFPLAKAADAYRAVARRRRSGKVLVRVR